MNSARNKRQFQRTHGSVPIELRHRGVPLRSTASALSCGGCHVALASALPVGTAVDVVLWTGNVKLAFRGTIRNADGMGNGVEFTGITEEQRTRLQRYLQEVNR